MNSKNLQVNLTLDNAILDMNYWNNGFKMMSSTLINAGKRKSFPLSRRSLRLNNNGTESVPMIDFNKDSHPVFDGNSTIDLGVENVVKLAKLTVPDNKPMAIDEIVVQKPSPRNRKSKRKKIGNKLKQSVPTQEVGIVLESLEPTEVMEVTTNESDSMLLDVSNSSRVSEVSPVVSISQATITPTSDVQEFQINQNNNINKDESQVFEDPKNKAEKGWDSEPSEPIQHVENISKVDRKMVEVMRQLKTTLSPKLTDTTTDTEKKCSRYGRHQKTKEHLDYIPGEIMKFISKSSPTKVKHQVPTIDGIQKLQLDEPTKVKHQVPTIDGIQKLQLDEQQLQVKIELVNDISETFVDVESHRPEQTDKASDVDSARGSSIIMDDLEDEAAKLNCGDILWGKCGSSAFWPCIVCPGPESDNILWRFKAYTKVHVRFFADNGRRSWITVPKDILKFEGFEDLERKLSKVADKKQNRMPTPHQRPFWESAIIQAQEYQNYNIEDRYPAYLRLLDEEKTNRLMRTKLKRQSITTQKEPDTLSVARENNKRSRSPTPESPPYESLDPEETKLEIQQDIIRQGIDRYFQSMQQQARPPPLKKQRLMQPIKKEITADDIDNDEQFMEFANTLNATVVKSGNATLLAEVKLYAKKLWLIKQLDERHDGVNTTTELAFINKHIDRKFSLRDRRSSSGKSSSVNVPSVQSISKPELKVIEVKEVKEVKPQEQLTLKEMFLSELEKNYLYKGLLREPVCQVCLKPDYLSKCIGGCCGFFHPTCCLVKQEAGGEENDTNKTIKKKLPKKQRQKTRATILQTVYQNALKKVNQEMDEQKQLGIKTEQLDEIVPLSTFKCNECLGTKNHKCFVCQSEDNFVQGAEELKIKCGVNGCGKYFHVSCLREFPQAIVNMASSSSSKSNVFYCPQHCCHTCVSDNPIQKTKNQDKPALIKCVKCPSSYHFNSPCIPAGSQFLTGSLIICPKHTVEVNRRNNLNVSWCFVCSLGGSLLCCELCPTSFHLECLDIVTPPSGRFICGECKTGRMPLYNEIVWAKYSVHKWWPAIILPPPVVPEMMLRKGHETYEFCVRFFGTHDFAWLPRARVYRFEDADSITIKKSNKTTYNQALLEAKDIYSFLQELKKTDNDPYRHDTKPPPYMHIKMNRPIPSVKWTVEEEEGGSDICNCSPTEEMPCSLNSNCLNRTLLIECSPDACPAGEKCMNQKFKKRDYPKIKVVRSNNRGWGLIAQEKINAGTFVIEYVGELIDSAELDQRMKSKQERNDENYYFLTINHNLIIDAGPKGNIARFMNHSCEPCCQTQKWKVNGQTRIGLFAMHDIEPNTELTFNYNLECVGDHKKVCHCGAPTCTGFIGLKKAINNGESNAKKLKKKTVQKRKSRVEVLAVASPNLDDVPKPMDVKNDEPVVQDNVDKSENP